MQATATTQLIQVVETMLSTLALVQTPLMADQGTTPLTRVQETTA